MLPEHTIRPTVSRCRSYLLAAAWTAAALACATDLDTLPEPIVVAADCENATTVLAWDPEDGDYPVAWPDDYFRVPTATGGYALSFDAARAPWLADEPALMQGVWRDLEALDGWGTSAAVVLTFSAPVDPDRFPTGPSSAAATSPIWWVALTEDGETIRIPFEARFINEDRTALLWPMFPLRPGTRHGVILQTSLSDAQGGCVGPSVAMRQILSKQAQSPDYLRLQARADELLQGAALTPSQVSFVLSFTTQNIHDTSLSVAADIAARSYTWLEGPTCQPPNASGLRRCDGRFQANDYRNEAGRVVDGRPQRSYTLGIALWLPEAAGSGPRPVALFGHGMQDERGAAVDVAHVLGAEGFITVANDAVAHGEHPDAPPAGSSDIAITTFFALNAEEKLLDALALRDNFRQSVYDRLQLIELLKADPDVDGDGVDDLDMTHLAYVGESFGGIMGSELLALSSDIGAAVIHVGGARVTSIITDAPRFAVLDLLLKPEDASDADMARLYPLVQAAIDATDPVNWAPRILADRLVGDRAPHLGAVMALDDATIPAASSHALFRAMQLPHVPPVRRAIEYVPPGPAAPFSGNVGGGMTAGFLQLDRITHPGETAPSAIDHDRVSASQEVSQLTARFLASWVATGVAELIDPYVVLETPEL